MVPPRLHVAGCVEVETRFGSEASIVELPGLREWTTARSPSHQGPS